MSTLITSVTDALGHTATMAYSTQNLPEAITDALGQTTWQCLDSVFAFDGKGWQVLFSPFPTKSGGYLEF